ncbi:RPII140-upstream gene protein isoform X2 [Dendroctonus ponderosae]|uniref:RPII140-upstream gene protein isoform X2 n=1 Tax=Dendroctonus ponderosae TaxID=77166 RepID=UPI00203529FD|nr:RPII140-upstream gene protein isoform X2 [Dendroctonus ponderosae]
MESNKANVRDRVSEFGTVSPEANSILQSGCMGIVVGAIYGGIVQGKSGYEEFMRNNEVTKFRTPFEAQSKLQEKVTIGFGKGALRWSAKIGLFTTLVISTSTMIQVYTGTYGIKEYAIAGAVAGSMYKFFLGPRAWLAGGAVGGALGFLGGSCTYGILQLTGQSLDDTKYWQQRFTQRREEIIREGLKEAHEEDEFAIVKLHDVEVGKSGESLDNLEKPKTGHLHISLKEEK